MKLVLMSTALIFNADPSGNPGMPMHFVSEALLLQVAAGLAFISLTLIMYQTRRVALLWRAAATALQTGSRQPIEVPRSARFLLLLAPKSYRESLVGDLEEEFYTIVLPQYGYRVARLWYWGQVACSLWPIFWDLLKRAAGLTFLWRITK